MNQTYPGCDDTYTDFCIQTRILTACLLLRELGEEAIVDELLADRAAMETLAHHPWDVIEVGEDGAREGISSRRATPYMASPDPRSQHPRSLVAEGMTLLG